MISRRSCLYWTPCPRTTTSGCSTPANAGSAYLTALTRLFLAQSARAPLLLLLENLQWIDEESRAFLDALIIRLPQSRLLLAMNFRPEFEHDWRGPGGLQPVIARSAAARSRAQAARHAAWRGPLPCATVRSAGRALQREPFFLEETVRSLVETKAIVGDRGDRRLVAKIDTLHVPTVQDVIAARIDRLSPEEKLLLQQASVIGAQVPLAVLEAVAEMDDEVFRRALYFLQVSGFIHQTSLFPELECRFRHILTREVARAAC